LIPFVGVLYLIVVSVLNSEVGTNEYGPDPKNRIRKNELIECPSCHALQDKDLQQCPNCGYNLGFYQAHRDEIIDVKVEEVPAYTFS